MSDLTDVSTWRLQTAGGIKYRLKEGKPTGSFGEQVESEEIYLIQAGDLMPFIAESFASSDWVDGAWNFQAGRSCPGLAGAMTRTVAYKSLDSSKPCDPYGVDPDAPEGTYCPFLELTISYATKSEDAGSSGSGDPNNPETYLEVSADAGVEFLMMKSSGNHAQYTASTTHQGLDATGNVATINPEDPETPQEPDLPSAKLRPTTEWTVRFPNFPWVYLSNLLAIARPKLGTINSTAMSILGNAAIGTVLFTGMSVRKQWQVQSSGSGNQLTIMAQVELKFSEKTATNSGSDTILGHNYFYRPELNCFDLLYINNQPVYKSSNLNTLWS